MTPTEAIQTPLGLTEKYIRISIDFPDMAGRIAELLAHQKRLVSRLAKSKQTDDVKELLQSVADSVTITDELLKWTHTMLQSVLADSKALRQGSEVRDKLRRAQEMNKYFLDAETDEVLAIAKRMKQQ